MTVNFRPRQSIWVALVVWSAIFLTGLGIGGSPRLVWGLAWGAESPDTLAPLPASVVNGNFECADGYTVDALGRAIPDGWVLARAEGDPEIGSTRTLFAGGCDGNQGFVERLEGQDSLVILAKDIETPPLPGKPFDVVLYQQVVVAPGGDYSVSGWMLSLCGGSAMPNDCPAGVHIYKAIGLDPKGGTDPDSPDIVWAENLDNFVSSNQERIGWTNLRVGTKAATNQITVFLRMHSPFQWHGNHGFIDAVHLTRAPVSWLVDLPQSVNSGDVILVRWDGLLSPEIVGISGGTHELLIDVQARRRGQESWQDLALGASAPGTCAFAAGGLAGRYEFRVRARAEQPPPPAPGAWPNQRFPGVWTVPQQVTVVAAPAVTGQQAGEAQIYLPGVGNGRGC